jgi:hypothetical protein
MMMTSSTARRIPSTLKKEVSLWVSEKNPSRQSGKQSRTIRGSRFAILPHTVGVKVVERRSVAVVGVEIIKIITGLERQG